MTIVQIKRHGEHSTFKLACDLGPSRSPGKHRIHVWSANSTCYSNAQTVREEMLHAIDVDALNARERRVYEAAKQGARKIGAAP